MDRNAVATEEEAWRRFDEAIAALRCARHADQAKAPDDELLANLESLSAPFRGSSRVLIVSCGGQTICEFDFHVQQSSTELYRRVATESGLVMLNDSVTLAKDDRQVLSHGFRAGFSVHLGIMISGILRPDHFWDFRGASDEVCDAYGGPVAHLRGGASCNQCGISLDGREGYVEIDPWEWAGPVTFETRVRYNTYANQAAVLALGTLLEDGRTNDLFSIMSYTMFVVRESPLKLSRVLADQPISLGDWFHIVATSEPGSTIMYINGVLAGSVPEGVRAKRLLRNAFLGRSVISENFMDGTISHVRIWHGTALPPDMVELLYQESLLQC